MVEIDASAAENAEGVIGFVGAADIPGQNNTDPIGGNEPVFLPVGAEINYHGQPIGLIVADSVRAAEAAAKLVKCLYSEAEKKPVITLEQAKAESKAIMAPEVTVR